MREAKLDLEKFARPNTIVLRIDVADETDEDGVPVVAVQRFGGLASDSAIQPRLFSNRRFKRKR